MFQSTLPVWGATDDRGACHTRICFNSRSPCGERHPGLQMMVERIMFQSTLPVWGATEKMRQTALYLSVSIHAPRVGSDTRPIPISDRLSSFNPRSPCGERRSALQNPTLTLVEFQSTLPVWGATGCRTRLQWCRCFNPRSPCGERRAVVIKVIVMAMFQSTLPVWGATSRVRDFQSYQMFQSTLPVWGATCTTSQNYHYLRFQSTLPVWGATISGANSPRICKFQSTLPVWGATFRHRGQRNHPRCFNPRSPCGERLIFTPGRGCRSCFNPRSPCGERHRILRAIR